MFSWFFNSQKISDKGAKSFSATQFTSDDLLNIIDGTFFNQGYAQLIFFGFDFTKNTEFECVLDKNKPTEKTTIPLSKLLCNMHCNKFFFHQALFTPAHLKILLENNCDLFRCTYRLKTPIEFIDYYENFYQLYKEENHNRLHGIQVNFCDCTLTTAEDTLLGVCDPVLFTNTSISQQQAIFLIENKSAIKSINLCHVSFENTEISEFIEKHDDRISFLPYSTSGCMISLMGSSINNAILDIKTLAFFALNPKYHHWFLEENFSFSLKFNDVIIPNITISSLLEKYLVEQTPRTGRTLAPLAFFDLLYATIKNDDAVKGLEPILFQEMKAVQKTLWVFYCAENHPDTAIGKRIWRLLGINRKFNYVSAPNAQSISPW